jgi:tetratricopeptide (TPR) repeat protein
VGALPRPTVTDAALQALFDDLHALHHRAGWPSLRAMAKEVGCSHTTISAAFSDPRLPRWGLVELIVEALGGDVEHFHRRWLAATGEPEPAAGEPPPAPAPDRPRPRELPSDVVAFTGRAGELATLDELLAGTGPAVPVAVISGTAGVGKTALAVHWSHRVADRFPDGQMHLNLRGYDPDQPVRAAEALEVLLRTLGVAGPAIPHGLAERAARYRTLVAGRRLLVVLDNAHSVDQVRDLLPGTGSCFVVVTSRDTLPALVARHGAVRLNLDLLAPAESVTLLRTLIGRRVNDDRDGATRLAERCARLPLALRIAAELAAARPAETLADLAAELGDESRLDLLAAGGDEYTAVRAVFSWSLRHLSEAAALAFTLLGLHPGVDIDRAATTALTGTDPATARGLVDALVRAHLLDDLGDGRYGMHDLLRAYAAERAAALPGPVRRAALERLFDHYVAAADGAAVTWLDAERANLIAVARAAADARTVRLSAGLAGYLDGRAHYRDALDLHGLAREAARTAGDRAGEGRACGRLGTVHRRLGDYQAALEWYRAALAIHRDVGDRAGESATRHGLGVAFWRLGRYPEALDHLGAALAIYRDSDDAAGVGGALTGLGIAHFQLGRYTEARDTHERALAVLRGIGDRTGEGRALNNLGVVHHRMAHHAEARDLYEQCLAIAREVGNRAGEGVALCNLGDLDVDTGRYGEARQRYEQAVALCRQIGYRVGQAEALRGLGLVAAHSGRLDEGLEYLGHAVTLSRELGERETEIRALTDLGGVLREAGRRADALDRYRTALALAGQTADAYARSRIEAAMAAILRDTGDEPAARPA